MIALLMIAAVVMPNSYKLILVVNAPPVVIDYPTKDRCDHALQVAKEVANTQLEQAQRERPPGAILTNPGLTATGMCIPS